MKDRNVARKRLLNLVEGALMVAFAVVLDLIPFPSWPQGGSISIAAIPLIYYSYRAGIAWGVGAGFVYSGVQMLTGFYVPPANTVLAILLCVLLDYVLAFGVFGLADVFARLFGKHRLVGYGVGALIVSLMRYVCSALSGIILWGSFAPEGMNVIWYSVSYNGSYMIPNAILATVLTVLLCMALDPRTGKPMKKNA